MINNSLDEIKEAAIKANVMIHKHTRWLARGRAGDDDVLLSGGQTQEWLWQEQSKMPCLNHR